MLSYQQLARVLLGQPLHQHLIDKTSLSPAQITANQNDYDPPNPARKKVWRLTSDASRNITGFKSHAIDGEEIIGINVGSFPIVILNESASSAAANRVHTDFGADLTMQPDDLLHLQYDLPFARWRNLTRPFKEVNKRLNAQFGTTSTTGADVTGMAFAVDANEQWNFEFNLRVGKSSGTAGLKFALTFPSGATVLGLVEGSTSGPTARTQSIITASGTLTTETYHTVANLNGIASIRGTIQNGATAGTLQLRLAAVTSNTASVEAGSMMRAKYSVTA